MEKILKKIDEKVAEEIKTECGCCGTHSDFVKGLFAAKQMVVDRIDEVTTEPLVPLLGCATTEELIDEVKARIEMDGKLGYRTID